MSRQAWAWVCSLLAGTAALTIAASAVSPQAPVFRATQDLVPVYVTVTDASGRLVTGLGASSFELLDNGEPQPITVFDATPQPIHLVVMLDVSGSMLGNLPTLRAACQQLFANLGPDDLARLGLFGSDVSISPAFTHDQEALVAALPTSINPFALTSLWRAASEAIAALHDVSGRRVLVVLTDGKDNPPSATRGPVIRQPDIVERARRDDVMIYAIGLDSFVVPNSPVSDRPDPLLSATALETGGGYFELPQAEELPASFTRVAAELHSQYLLGFSPSARDGRIHQLELRITPPALVARARKSYLAPSP